MKRIDFIASLVKGFNKVADIGADHGKVLKVALDNKYINSAIAADINEGPLSSAKKTLTGYPVEFYLSDGFKSVKSDYDCAIITGMGPELIIDILKNGKNNATYILGPNKKEEVLRSYLSLNGYTILDEFVIFDGFFYVFLKVVKGYDLLSDEDIILGPKLKSKLEANDYYLHKYNLYKDVIIKQGSNKNEDYIKIYNFLKEKVIK